MEILSCGADVSTQADGLLYSKVTFRSDLLHCACRCFGNTLGFVLGDECQEDRWVFQVLNTSYAVSVWLCTFLGPQEILRILKSCH